VLVGDLAGGSGGGGGGGGERIAECGHRLGHDDANQQRKRHQKKHILWQVRGLHDLNVPFLDRLEAHQPMRGLT